MRWTPEECENGYVRLGRSGVDCDSISKKKGLGIHIYIHK